MKNFLTVTQSRRSLCHTANQLSKLKGVYFMRTPVQNSIKQSIRFFLFVSISICFSSVSFGQENLSAKNRSVYEHIKSFSLSGGASKANGLVLKRDRGEMTFDGVFYFTSSVEGRVTGAVFIGQGKFRAELPENNFEKDNVKRLLGADVIESDFKTAVLRFSDDTFNIIGKGASTENPTPENAQKIATEADARILKEVGANIPARLTISILNSEKPGFFFATFDGGKRDRFSFMLDYQNRITVANFGINGGEKGMIYAYQSVLYGYDVWLAFYSLEDYKSGVVEYSDVNDIIDITHYQMDIDLREHKSRLKLTSQMTSQVLSKNIQAVSFLIGESLPEYENRRLNKQMRVKSVRSGGIELSYIQENWEGGFTIFLPNAMQSGQKLELDFQIEGDFMLDADFNCSYPASNTDWYPRHGYLDRATFDLTYRHKKSYKIATVGERLGEEPDSSNKEIVITKHKLALPVSFVTFALGPFERHKQMVKWEKGGIPIPLEFSSLPGALMAIKEDFIVAEMDNAIRYFSYIFGNYPYPVFGAAVHPYPFGQGMPTLLMIPPTDRASKYTYAFIAHETAHQWWGNIVAWRSYRDQWLSEGFAEYSGMLYTALRDSNKSREELINRARSSLKDPPITTTGVGKGRLVDVGPIILGHRLNTSRTFGAYQTLIYEKGALVLRMLHFLMSNPSDGTDKPFFDMMTAFVEKYRNGVASTDDFRMIANEHFANTPIAKKYGLKDLNWFFRQWVYETSLPSYTLEYQIQNQPDGSVIVSGNVIQENAPAEWFMPLPIVFNMGGDKEARGTIHAYGPKAPFQIKLPMKPQKVELDPKKWILSEKTTTKG
jgi:hypothetical protein